MSNTNKSIKIGGILYPSASWYSDNVLARGRKAVGGREVRVLPDEAPITRNLEHTLPPEGEETTAGGLELPTEGAGAKIDGLTLLSLALKGISKKALEKREESATMGMIGTAGAAMGKFESMGFDPSRMPGGFSGKIISMARQKAAEQLARERGEITNQFDTTEAMLKSIKESNEREQDLARKNLGVLMETRSLSALDDKELENLSSVAGIPLEQLTAIKNAENADKSVINAYIKGVESGKINISSVPSNMRNDVINGIDWEEVEGGEVDEITPKDQSVIDAFTDKVNSGELNLANVPAEYRGDVAIKMGAEIDWNTDTIKGLKEQGINDDEILAAAKADGKEEEVRTILEQEYKTGVMDTGGIVGEMSDTAYSLFKKAKSWLK